MGARAPPAVSERLAGRRPTWHCSIFLAGFALLVAAEPRSGSTCRGTSFPAQVRPGSIHQHRGASEAARGAGHTRHTDSVGHTDRVGHTDSAGHIGRGRTGGTRGSGAWVTGQPAAERHMKRLKEPEWAAGSATNASQITHCSPSHFPGPTLHCLQLCDPVGLLTGFPAPFLPLLTTVNLVARVILHKHKSNHLPLYDLQRLSGVLRTKSNFLPFNCHLLLEVSLYPLDLSASNPPLVP